MNNEDINGAIDYLKSYRKLDEKLHNMSPKDSVSYFATDKCLKYWDMAIKALKQYVADCDNCCGGVQTEKAKLCQKSYLAGMEHSSNKALQEIRQEILDKYITANGEIGTVANGCLNIIDKHIKEIEG